MNKSFLPQFEPDVSVITVNFNGLHFLESFLASLNNVAFKQYTFETIIIDNASSDGSQVFLRERKDICYIESSKNLGFTGGNNQAALKARGKVLLLLNNDTRIESCLDPLIDAALSESTGAVGCRLVYGDGRLQFSVGLDHSPLRLVFSWLGLEKLHRLPPVFRRMQTDPLYYDIYHDNVDWISGACLATRRDIWNQLKGLDESFFMYCEDVDYCLRARNIGKNIIYIPDVKVTHYEGAGKVWVGSKALKRTVYSYNIFTRKHSGNLCAVLVMLSLGCVFFIRSIVFKCIAIVKKDNENRIVFQDKSISYIRAAITSVACVFSKGS